MILYTIALYPLILCRSALLLALNRDNPDPSVEYSCSLYSPFIPPSGTSPSANIRSNFLTSSVVFASVNASTTLFFSSGVINLPLPPFPTAPPVACVADAFVDADNVAPEMADVEGIDNC